jgi:hypothetical protein
VCYSDLDDWMIENVAVRCVACLGVLLMVVGCGGGSGTRVAGRARGYVFGVAGSTASLNVGASASAPAGMAAIPGASVKLYRIQRAASSGARAAVPDATATTDGGGIYNFESLAVGDYNMTVSASGYRDARFTLTVEDGKLTEGAEQSLATQGRIYFMRMLNDVTGYVCSVKPDGTDLQEMRQVLALNEAPISFGSDVTRFVCGSATTGKMRIYSTDGQVVRDIPLRCEYPSLSPDGSKIAYVGIDDLPAASSNIYEIHVVNSDGSGEKRLTYGGFSGTSRDDNRWPTWMPDSSRIVFLGSRAAANTFYLYSVPFDGSTAESTYFTIERLWKPRWGTQPSLIALRLASGSQMQIVSLSGGSLSTVVQGEGIRDSPYWSPNASYVVFVENGKLWVAPAGGTPQAITSGADDRHPVWVPSSS